MLKPKKILYIMFIDMESPISSGSSLRPKKMLEALVNTGEDVRYVFGEGNVRNKRKKAFRQVEEWIKSGWIPDMCYIEPPSGPLFFRCDRMLLKLLNRKGVPIAIFYRDAYWRFPDCVGFNKEKRIKDIIKNKIINIMQKRDWKLYNLCCKKIYFPSEKMASYFKSEKKGVLPPGCDAKNYQEKKMGESWNAIYVGGATEEYGISLMLDSLKDVNSIENRLKLYIICPQKGWEEFISLHPKYNGIIDNVEIVHCSDGPELDELYSKSDFALIPRLKNEYHDFAFPIKLVEYVSHGLPVITTNCDVCESFVEKYSVGLVANDSLNSYSDAIVKMLDNREKYIEYVNNCKIACINNTWNARVNQVVKDLIE